MRRSLVFATVLLMCSVARAQAPVDGARTVYATSHRGQVGGDAALGLGYRVLFPYHDGEFCGMVDRKVCSGRSPAFLALGLSYGVSDTVDLLVELRLGLDGDFKRGGSMGDGPKPVWLAPGAKFFFDESGRWKLFSTVQLAIDFTDYTGSGASGTDYGLHNSNGLLYELSQNFGLYARVGETVGVVRWLRFELEGGVGLQGRLP